MPDPNIAEPQPLDPEQAAALAKVRRLMMIGTATTFLAIAVVFALIGYKLFNTPQKEDEAPQVMADVTDSLPAGARVVSTQIGNDHIVLTIDVGGVTELRTYDPDTLKLLGRLRLPAGR